MCYNKRLHKFRGKKRLHKLVEWIDIKVDECIPAKYTQIRNIESSIDDTGEYEEEQVQESEKEDSESDNECVDLQ